MKSKKLNIRQQLFADHYIKTGHITNSAVEAGYSKKTAYAIGSKLLKKVEILEYVQVRKKELEDLLRLSKARVLAKHMEIVEKTTQATPVMEYDVVSHKYVQATEIDKNGKEVGLYTFDSAGAERALENIAKMMGYNEAEKVEVNVPIQVNVNFNWPKKEEKK